MMTEAITMNVMMGEMMVEVRTEVTVTETKTTEATVREATMIDVTTTDATVLVDSRGRRKGNNDGCDDEGWCG